MTCEFFTRVKPSTNDNDTNIMRRFHRTTFPAEWIQCILYTDRFQKKRIQAHLFRHDLHRDEQKNNNLLSMFGCNAIWSSFDYPHKSPKNVRNETRYHFDIKRLMIRRQCHINRRWKWWQWIILLMSIRNSLRFHICIFFLENTPLFEKY